LPQVHAHKPKRINRDAAETIAGVTVQKLEEAATQADMEKKSHKTLGGTVVRKETQHIWMFWMPACSKALSTLASEGAMLTTWRASLGRGGNRLEAPIPLRFQVFGRQGKAALFQDERSRIASQRRGVIANPSDKDTVN